MQLGDKNSESLMPSREKYWEEKDDKQKLAKLADIIISMASMLQRHDELLDEMMIHTHGLLGQLEIPLKRDKRDYLPYWLKNPLGKEK